jgi:hypothetical protein
MSTASVDDAACTVAPDDAAYAVPPLPLNCTFANGNCRIVAVVFSNTRFSAALIVVTDSNDDGVVTDKYACTTTTGATCTVGATVGRAVGARVVVGRGEGRSDGLADGRIVGRRVGVRVGVRVGDRVGVRVGDRAGAKLVAAVTDDVAMYMNAFDVVYCATPFAYTLLQLALSLLSKLPTPQKFEMLA